ncbi:hypothetical protein GGS24DRAFT_498490 [Hypoxylon argillaceum]|nr:hypothetical protein GGS24DRAFT_498490 [Hypoxylon argillaceum]KAI1151601.1 hypothetical protein F4825DRAFT_351251 [Nemania diffusa]
MKFSTTLSAGLALAGMSAAAPVVARDKSAAEIIGIIAPASLSCADATECRTNVQAAPFLIAAMAQYKLQSPGQIAAVLALTAFESVNYQYKHNVSPGRPGQGTSNMQMIDYNVEYAKSIPALADKVAALGDITGTDKQNQLLALVNADEYNFGSGPWFLTTKCTPEVVSGLQAGTDAAFSAYMGCVGVQLTDDRTAYWTRAKTAFGL